MSPDIGKKTTRKVSLRIIPFIMCLYYMVFLDRINLGFASLSMNKDLNLSSAEFGFGAGIFFWGYLLCEIPSNLALHRVGARLWIARIMVSLGVLAAIESLINGSTGFYIVRFLLGAAEAGFFPGVIFYISHWFPAQQRAKATSLFMASAPLAAVFGSPLSGVVLGLSGFLGLKGWQWLFLSEAVPALFLGMMCLFYMTDRPEQASWLEEDERAWLVTTINAEKAAKVSTETSRIGRAISDPRVLALALVYFGTSAGLYTLGVWAPQIIKSFGVTNIQVGFLNAVPPALAIVGMYVWAWHSDRTNERPFHVILPCLLAAAGLFLVNHAAGVVSVVAALAVVNVGITSAKSPFWSLPTMFLSGPGAAAGLATINSVGSLGGFVGPAMIGWIKTQTHDFTGGLYFVSALLILSAVVTFVVSRFIIRPMNIEA
ncbi:MFS transporter [Acetobacter musti]|nr:MFS transporter [Acetobacter musti]NHN86909.1 MFS transporter [Acetobacter musti]